MAVLLLRSSVGKDIKKFAPDNISSWHVQIKMKSNYFFVWIIECPIGLSPLWSHMIKLNSQVKLLFKFRLGHQLGGLKMFSELRFKKYKGGMWESEGKILFCVEELFTSWVEIGLVWFLCLIANLSSVSLLVSCLFMLLKKKKSREINKRWAWKPDCLKSIKIGKKRWLRRLGKIWEWVMGWTCNLECGGKAIGL